MQDHSTYRRSPGVNWSTLSAMRQSPAAYHHRLTTPREATPAMLLGRLIHTAVLEPAQLLTDYAVWEGGRRGTNEHKAWLAEIGDREQTTTADMEKALAIAEAVRSHPAAHRALRGGHAEKSLHWTDPATRLRCKGRVDHIRFDRGETTLTDLKSTRQVEPRAFGRSVEAFGIHGQLALYRRGMDVLGYKPGPVRIVAVEQEPPHEVAVYLVPDEVLDAGAQLVDRLLAEVKKWRTRRRWPVRFEDEVALQFPTWAIPEYDDDIEVLS
jgi:hypothetical protein